MERVNTAQLLKELGGKRENNKAHWILFSLTCEILSKRLSPIRKVCNHLIAVLIAEPKRELTNYSTYCKISILQVLITLLPS